MKNLLSQWRHYLSATLIEGMALKTLTALLLWTLWVASAGVAGALVWRHYHPVLGVLAGVFAFALATLLSLAVSKSMGRWPPKSPE